MNVNVLDQQATLVLQYIVHVVLRTACMCKISHTYCQN